MPPIRSLKKNLVLEKNAQQLGIKSSLTRELAKDVSTSKIKPPRNSEKALPAAVEALADANTPPAVKNAVDAFQALRSASQGQKEAHFYHNSDWEKSWQTKLSARTRKLTFGSSFVLTDQHIEQLISLGPGICRRLTHFEFEHQDISYKAHNANELTEVTTVRLARMCPGLRVVKLQGVNAKKLSDATLIAFLSNCPNLISIEVTGLDATRAITEACFNALLEHPTWAPKLKTLRVPTFALRRGKTKDSWMKAMRTLSKQREMLLIEVTSVSQVKRCGDWEIETWPEKFRKGRVVRQP